ncbi:MAG: class I SAM-dependent methyltransferase [Infirmifilum sp.]
MSTIIDIGCGTGHFILIAEKYSDRKQGKSMKLIGVDIDREVLRKAKTASEYSLFINADMFLLPLRDNPVDCVYFSHVIEHIVDPRPVLGEFKRILRKGGCLVVITPTYHRWFFTPGHVRPYTLRKESFNVRLVGYSHILFVRKNLHLIKELINVLPIMSFKEVIIAIASKR